MKRQKNRWRFSQRTKKLILIGCLMLAGLFIVSNGVLWSVYQDRTYPGTKVMNSTIGSVPYSALASKVDARKLIPTTVTFQHNQQKTEASLTKIGIAADIGRTTKSANKQRSWLPIINLFKAPELLAPVTINSQTLAAKTNDLAKAIRKDSANARLVIDNGAVSIANAQNGYELDRAKLQSAIVSSLDKGSASIKVPVATTRPQVQAAALKAQKTDLENQLKTAVTYRYAGKSKQASKADIGNWYTPSGEGYVLSSEKVQAYIAATGVGFGIRVKDVGGVAANTIQSVSKKQALDTTLVQQVALKTFAYCVAARGVDAANLSGLKSKLKETYGSSRGWSVDGLVEYKEVTSGCNFTVWLTAASLMPSFGAICDSMWSCRVGPNVVINFDRWQNASPAWNQMGGSLDEYRHMVINHETGHWLGFDHAMCPGPGQQAPVMQQQSIDLQGCSFNAWPVSSEILELRRSLNI